MLYMYINIWARYTGLIYVFTSYDNIFVNEIYVLHLFMDTFDKVTALFECNCTESCILTLRK